MKTYIVAFSGAFSLCTKIEFGDDAITAIEAGDYQSPALIAEITTGLNRWADTAKVAYWYEARNGFVAECQHDGRNAIEDIMHMRISEITEQNNKEIAIRLT